MSPRKVAVQNSVRLGREILPTVESRAAQRSLGSSYRQMCHRIARRATPVPGFAWSPKQEKMPRDLAQGGRWLKFDCSFHSSFWRVSRQPQAVVKMPPLKPREHFHFRFKPREP